ncbi:baseplate protein [Staphylococcus phage vB_SauH_DELF3]|nr:baseplate protein [Staphylococcus phage vB_SauH_DELF3]
MKLPKHEGQSAETLQSPSLRDYGDVSCWFFLIEHNNLQYGYIVDTDEEKKKNPEHLITTGDRVILPLDAELTESVSKHVKSRDKDVLVALALGRVYHMTANNEYIDTLGTNDAILALSSDGRGDLDIVKGIDWIKQSLRARLLTEQGSLLLHPERGSNILNLFGLVITENFSLIEVDVLKTIKSDNRGESAILNIWKIKDYEYYGSFNVEIKSVEESIYFVLGQDDTGGFALID